MILVTLGGVFLALIQLSLAIDHERRFSALFSVFRDCWTEIVVDNVSESALQQRYITYPILFSLLSSVPYFPLYSTKEANETYKLIPKCLAIILLPSDWNIMKASLVERILDRYAQMSLNRARKPSQKEKPGKPWYDKQFKLENSFVVGISSEEVGFDWERKFGFFSRIRWECGCSTLQITMKDTTSDIVIAKTMYYRHISASSTLINSTTISTIQKTLLNSLQLRFKNMTKYWDSVALKYQKIGTICVSRPPTPSTFLQLTDLKSQKLHFLKHIINFLSAGKYGGPRISNHFEQVSRTDRNEEMPRARTYDKENCDKNLRMFHYFEAGWNLIFMRDDDFRSLEDDWPEIQLSRGISILPSTFPNDFNFITCDGRYQGGNSYSMFITPLDVTLRLTLLGFVFLFLVIGPLFIWKVGTEDSAWLIIYPILIEVSPQISSKLQSNTAFAFILIPATFSGILIANGYKGILTSDLTAPLPWKGLETFNDVLEKNYTVFGDLNTPPVLLFQFYELCVNAHKLHINTFFMKMLQRSISLGGKETNITKKRMEFYNKFSEKMTFPQRIDLNCTLPAYEEYERTFFPDPNLKIPSELAKCHKSVYAIPSEEIYFHFTKMSQSEKLIYHGKSAEMEIFKYNNEHYALILNEITLDRMYIQGNLDGLNSGGFLFYWESLMSWPNKRKYDKQEDLFQRNMAQPSPMSLSTKAGSIFIILITGISLALFTILLEIVFARFIIFFKMRY